MSFPRYPAYKDSGVDWLGAVPAHWDVTRVANLFLQVDEPGNEDLPILSVSIHTGVSDKEMSEQEMERKVTRSDDRSTYKRVAPGDLTYNMMRAWQGAFGAVATDGMVSPAYVVARPKGKFITQFVEHQLRSPNAIEEMRRYSRGVTDFRLRLYWEDFKAVQLALPPLDDQIQIVQVLERETAKIDALVAEQEQLVTLLKEKRQAVISHAVTKGLDPAVPMKDSGVKWLGDVPAHWCLGKVKQFFATTSGSTPNTDRQDVYYNGDIAWIRSLDLTDGDIVEWEVGITPSAIEDTACKLLPVGTVLVAMYGGDGTIGKNGLLRIPAATNQAICALLPSPLFENEFVLAFMQHQRPYWMVGAEGTRKDPNISQDRVRNAVMPCPPLSEQKVIVEHVRQALSAFGSLEKEAQAVIEILNERRFALISAAVTGQIDVRALEPAHAA